MFTGIIEAVGAVVSADRSAGGRRLLIDLVDLADFDIEPGDSVAVDGACLTAAAVAPPRAAFDCVAETLERTTLGSLRAGSRVNVERALRADGRLGGHLVQGHVDGVGAVARLDRGAGQTLLHVRAPDFVDQMVLKGSVAVSGVSLTIAALDASGFAVALAPFTLAHTVLGDLKPGDRVNLEADLIGKYVRAHLAGRGPNDLTQGFLAEHGFS